MKKNTRILLLVLFYNLLDPSRLSAQHVQRHYAWQADDSALIEAMPTHPVIHPLEILEQEVSGTPKPRRSGRHILKILKSCKPEEKTRPEPTKTERKKKSEVQEFIKKIYTNARENTFDREAAIQELMEWHHSKLALILDEPQLDEFIQNRLSKRDSKTLYVLATFFDKAARAYAEKETGSQRAADNVARLEGKALAIVAKIQDLPHVNKLISKRIEEHVEWMKQNKPDSYYQYLVARAQPFAFPGLGILDPHNPLRDLQPQAQKNDHVEAALIVTQTSTVLPEEQPKIIVVVAEPNVPVQEPTLSTSRPALAQTKPHDHSSNTLSALNTTREPDVPELVRAYKKAFISKKFQKAVNSAWQVIQRAPKESLECKHALGLIDLVLNLKETTTEINCAKHSALMAKTVLHKQDANPTRAILYFMEAQKLRGAKLVVDPQEIDPTTFAALTGTLKTIMHNTDPVTQQAIDYITALANSYNQQAIQALATHYHKAASENPATQLLNLRMAFQHLNHLDTKSDPLPGFNARQILFDYYQQLYTFARFDEHATAQGIMDMRKYFFLTRLLADALIGLNRVASTPEQEDWKTQARCTLKGNLLKISAHSNRFLEAFNPQNPAQRADIHTLILDGTIGLALSIGQRKKILEKLRAYDPQDPLIASLSGPYEASEYYKRSVREKNAGDHDYYRMLFALDKTDYKTALALAHKASREHNDYRAQMYISNILLYTNLIPRTDDQKLESIRSVRQDLMNPLKMWTLFPVHADALELAHKLAAQNHLPTLEYLVDVYCADHAKRYNPMMYKKLFAQIKQIIKTSGSAQGLPVLSAPDFYTDFIYMCWLDKSLDPAWEYMDCLLEFVLQSTDAKRVQQAAAILERFAEDVGVNLAIDKQPETTTPSEGHQKLKEKIGTVMSNKTMVEHLKSNGCHQAAVKLYWSLNPDQPPLEDNLDPVLTNLSQLFVPMELLQTQNETGHELALAPKYSKTNKREILDFATGDINQLKCSPSFQRALAITDFRKRGDFQLYAKTYGNEPWHQPGTTDRREYVIDLLVKAAHEYMMAQAHASTELTMLEIPAVQALVQQAITIDPVYTYMNISYLLQENSIWPHNAHEGYKYLHKATQSAENYKKKLHDADIISLNKLKQRYASIIAISTLANTIHSHSNTLSSGKIE